MKDAPLPPVVPLRDTFLRCPRCGRQLPSPGHNPARCESCLFVYYFSPIAAVGAVLARPDGKILLLVRGREPQAGKWCLPGGFVDVGESLERALAREIQEETGLESPPLTYLCSGPNPYDYAGIRVDVLDTFFWGTAPVDRRPVPQPGEVDSIAWADPAAPDTLRRLAFDSHRDALKQFVDRVIGG